MARHGRNNGGYGNGGMTPRKPKSDKSCMIRFIWDNKKTGFIGRAMINPVYAFKAWQRFCNVPVLAHHPKDKRQSMNICPMVALYEVLTPCVQWGS